MAKQIQPDDMFYRSCLNSLDFTISRYLMSNNVRFMNGAEKATRHREICCFYTAIYQGIQPDHVDVCCELYQKIHKQTQIELTNRLDEVIGFPIEDHYCNYSDYVEPFFSVFHKTVMNIFNQEMMSETMIKQIQQGDIVQIDFHCSHITISRNAKVVRRPVATGDGWDFECLDTGKLIHISEGCTLIKVPLTKVPKDEASS